MIVVKVFLSILNQMEFHLMIFLRSQRTQEYPESTINSRNSYVKTLPLAASITTIVPCGPRLSGHSHHRHLPLGVSNGTIFLGKYQPDTEKWSVHI